jgi:hypothetical protein
MLSLPKTRWLPVLVGVVSSTAALASPGAANAGCLSPPGDYTGNAEATVVDVQCLLLTILSPPDEPPGCFAAPLGTADADCDGERTVADAILSVQWALGSALSPQIDADGSQCPDACEVPHSYTSRPIFAVGKSTGSAHILVPRGAPGSAVGSSSGTSFKLVSRGVLPAAN